MTDYWKSEKKWTDPWGITWQINIAPEELSLLDEFDDEPEYEHFKTRVVEARNREDYWLWCTVWLRASVSTCEAQSYLGACSYDGLEHFMRCPYFVDTSKDVYEMLLEKCDDLLETIKEFKALNPPDLKDFKPGL